jgi:hypothetical protein
MDASLVLIGAKKPHKVPISKLLFSPDYTFVCKLRPKLIHKIGPVGGGGKH